MEYDILPSPKSVGVRQQQSLSLKDQPHYRAGQTAYDTGTGFWLGVDSSTARFSIGNSAGDKLTWNGSALSITGTLSATLGTIGGWTINTSSLSAGSGNTTVGLDTTSTGADDIRIYAGSATASSAPFRVTESGVVTASDITITGGAISATPISAIPNNTSTDISLLEHSHNLVFSVTDLNTVTWSAGTTVLSNGRSFSIVTGNTGDMAALTYIYLDPAVSSTVLQTTTTYSTAMGANKKLIGSAQNGTTTASWVPYGPGTALINGDLIGALSITTANVAASAITTAKIAADAVTAAEIAAGAVGTSELAALAVTTAKIAASAVTAVEIAAATITTAKIALDAIDATLIAAGAVGSSELAAGAVIAGKITAGTIVAADIAASTITGAKIAATTITAANIAALTITASEIATGAITTAKIAALAVTAAEIAANTITAAKITALTITAAEIAANTITAAKIAALTITASEIAANTITAAKIAAGTITTTEIATLTIVAGNIAANTITAGKMSVSQLSAITADMGTLTAGTITLDSSGNIKSGQTDYNTSTGFWLGFHSATSTSRFSLGNPSGSFMTWNGSQLSIGGVVQVADTISVNSVISQGFQMIISDTLNVNSDLTVNGILAMV